MLCPISLIDIKCLSLTQNSPSISPHCYLYIYATYLNLDKLSLSTVISHCHLRVYLRSAAPSSAGLLPAECRDSVAPSSGHRRTLAVSPAASARHRASWHRPLVPHNTCLSSIPWYILQPTSLALRLRSYKLWNCLCVAIVNSLRTALTAVASQDLRLAAHA